MKANESGAVPLSHPLRGGGTWDKNLSRRPKRLMGQSGTTGTLSCNQPYIIDGFLGLGGCGISLCALSETIKSCPAPVKATGAVCAYPHCSRASSKGGDVGACPRATISSEANKLSSSGRSGIHASCCVCLEIMTSMTTGFNHRLTCSACHSKKTQQEARRG